MPFRYGESVKGQLFQLVHDICDVERGISMQAEHTTVQWQASRDAFAGYLALNPVFLKFLPGRRNGNFMVSRFVLQLDDGDTQLDVAQKDGLNFDNDPFVVSMLDQARQIFTAHDHETCVIAAGQVGQAIGTPLVTHRARTGDVICQ